MGITHLLHKIRFATLRKRIENNPYIGQEAADGTYVYKSGNYSISYRIIKMPEGKLCMEWVSHECRLGAYGEKIRRIREGFLDFWLYRKWVILFRPSILLILFISAFIFYSEVIETQATKMARFRWIIASAVGINPRDVQYIGNGWMEISGQRRRIEQRIDQPGEIKYIYEPIKYALNPLSLFFPQEAGFIKRWRSESGGGYATHPVVYNDKGEIWFKKQDTWEHGSISGEDLKWDRPQVTGLSIRKTPGHEISIQDRKLKIIDK